MWRVGLVVLFAIARTSYAEDPAKVDSGRAHYFGVNFKDVKWEKMFPQFGDDSPQISILRVDPKTKATQLLVRTPTALHVPKHWHSANETHTIISGVFAVECDGKREALGPGSFNYIPAKMQHEAWVAGPPTKADTGVASRRDARIPAAVATICIAVTGEPIHESSASHSTDNLGRSCPTARGGRRIGSKTDIPSGFWDFPGATQSHGILRGSRLRPHTLSC